jgi:hypothetical protein
MLTGKKERMMGERVETGTQHYSRGIKISLRRGDRAVITPKIIN